MRDSKGRFMKGHKKIWTKKSLEKLRKSHTGNKNSKWKGGRLKTERGYILIYAPDHPYAQSKGYVREHRLIIEEKIGRYLLPNEEPHHLGDKDDNRPQMLMAFVNHSAHQRFEQDGIVKPEEIIFDGREYGREKGFSHKGT